MLALRFRFHLALSGEQGGFAEPVEGVVHGAVYLLRGRGVAGHNEGVLRIGIENQLGFGVGGAKSLGFLVGHYRIFLAVEDKDGRGLGVDVEEWREEAGLGGGGRAVGPFPGEVGDGVEGDDGVGALPRDSAQGERQMAPGAVAGGDDALRVDAEFGRVAADPYEGGLDVFDGGPDGAEAILEGEAHDTLRRGVLHCREEHLRSAAGPTAAVDPEYGGTGGGAATEHGERESGLVFEGFDGLLFPRVGGDPVLIPDDFSGAEGEFA